MATAFAFVKVRLNASTVLTSGLAAPARTATPSGTCANSTSVPTAIRFAAISSLRPSLDRMTTSVRHAAGELGSDRLRRRSLGRAGSGGDFGATLALELRQ